MKIFYFDLETTGLDSDKNAIHQLSALIFVDGKLEQELDIKMQPFENAEISPEALKVAHVTKDQILNYERTQEEAYKLLLATLSHYVNRYDKSDKFFIAGYNNASFDNNFLRAFFLRNNDKYFGSWFWSNPLDVFILASQKLLFERSKMPNFKLMTVARQLGISIDESKLHDALYDVQVTREIHKIITQ